MKGILWLTIGIFVYTFINFGNMGIKNETIMKRKYKNALDAGANAAVKHISYLSEENLIDFSSGFGVGYENKQNIPVDPDQAKDWFYKVFYRNLGVEGNEDVQNKLKRYIPMKSIILFDKIMIADVNDLWIVEKEFIISYNGKNYLFTLSDQIQDLETSEWVRDIDLGLTEEERKRLVVNFIKEEIETFVNNRENMESNIYYTINIGLNDYDPKLSTLNGVNFITLVEGMPLPSLNVFNANQKLYAFSFGGSEIVRKE